MARTVDHERKAVESLAGKIKRSKAEFGREVTGAEAHRQAVRIAERSARERAERKK